MKTIKVQIDVLGVQEFSAYTNGDTWNGYECPYFTESEGKKIIKAFEDEKLDYNTLFNGKAFIFESEDVEETEIFEAIQIDNKTLYPIGSHCWTWTKA